MRGRFGSRSCGYTPHTALQTKRTLWRTCDKAGAPSFYVQLNFWFITSQLLRGGQIVKTWYNIITDRSSNKIRRIVYMTFGQKIKSLRREANMTQENLAELLSISPQAISRWETDVAMPDISLLPPLANLFNVTTDYLLGMETYQKDLRKAEFDKQRVVVK